MSDPLAETLGGLGIDDSAAATRGSDAPPNRGRTSSKTSRETRPSPSQQTAKWKTLHDQIAGLYVGVSMAVNLTGDMFSASVIRTNAEPCADAWIELAKTDARVERILRAITTGGAWAGIATAHLAIVYPILVHHDKLPVIFTLSQDESNGNGANPS